MTEPAPGLAVPAAPAPATSLARGTTLGVAAEALVLPAGLLTAAYLTRTLGPDLYGRLSLVYALVAPVMWISATAFAGRAAVKLVADSADWRAMAAQLLRANLAFGIATAALFALLARPLASAVGDPGLAQFLWLASTEIVLMPVVRLHRDVLIAQGRLSWPAAATFSYHVGRLGLIVVAVASGYGIEGVVVANVAARLVELGACWIRLRIPFRGATESGLAPFRAFLGNLFVYALCVQLFNRADLVMLGVFGAPNDALGHFGAAQNLAIAPGLVAMVSSPMLIAALRQAELRGGDAEADTLRRDSTRVALAIWALIAPVAAGATAVIVLFFGSDFAPAGPIFALLGLGAGAALLLSILTAQEVAAGHFRRPLLAVIPMLVIALILHLVLIPRWGGMGAAAATASSAVVASLVATTFGGRERLAPMMNGLARAALAGATGALATWLFGAAGFPPFLDILSGISVTVAALLAFGLVRIAAIRSLIRSLSPQRLQP
jgi:O-antigen/teichoic acid export membrane protein